MTEITAEGPVSTTTVIDSKNGAIPIPHMKVSKRSVSEDFATTFSSPAAWLLVAALIVTWSAVAIVMFDLVDYKTLAGIHQFDIVREVGKAEIPRGQSVSKFATDPLKLLHGAVEETTNSVYGFLSLMSDLIFEDEEEGEKGDVQPSMKVKEEVQPMVKKKEIQIDKPEKEEKIEKKALPREIQTEKPKKEEKVEKKLPPKLSHKEKPEKPEKVKKPEKPEKLEKPVKKEVSKVIQKEKPERHEKPEKREKPEKKQKTEKPEKPEKKEKVLPKEKAAKQEKPTKKPAPSPKVTEKVKPERQQKIEEKVSPKDKKSAKVEEKTKKDVKERKPESKAPEKVTSKEAQVQEVRPAKGKGKDKEEATLVLAEKSDTKGPAPHLFLSQIPAITPALPAAEVGTPNVTAIEPKKEAKRRKEVPETKATHGVKTKALEEEKKVTHEKKAVSEMKTKGGKEERKKALGKTAVPEVKKAEPEKAPAAQPASVKAAAPAKQPVKDVPVKASVTQETHHKLKDAERTKIQPAAHLTKKAVHEKKEDRLLKAVEQDVAKEKLKFPTAMKGKEAGKPKEVKPTQKQKAEVIKETKETSHRLTAGQKVIKHGKDVPQRKPEITIADKKKTEKPLKEKERKMAEVTHLKEEKAKVPAVKESHHHHNMTTDKLSKAAKTTAVRYYQCVFVNGYNDHKAQHPVTPAPDYKGKTVQSTKASGHKIKTLKQ